MSNDVAEILDNLADTVGFLSELPMDNRVRSFAVIEVYNAPHLNNKLNFESKDEVDFFQVQYLRSLVTILEDNLFEVV